MANVRTLKYKVYVKDGNRDEIWAYLRELQTATRGASNYLYSLYYLRDTALPPSDVHPATQGYRECRDRFPTLPSTVAAKLSNTLFALYRKERKDIFAGKRAVRSYKNALPIPERKTQVRFVCDPAGAIEIVWNTVVKGKVHLGVVPGRDRGNYSDNLKAIIDGRLPYGDLSFAVDDHDLYALIPVKDEPQALDLDPAVSVGVDVGIAIPAVCAVSNSSERAYIGDRDDFLRIRTHLQSAKRRLQRNLSSTKGGHGRKKKLAPLERVEGKERNFVCQYNHMVSSRVVDFTLKARAATIKLEYLEEYGREDRLSYTDLVGAMNVKRAGLARIACGVSAAREPSAHEPTEANEEDSPFGAVGSDRRCWHGDHELQTQIEYKAKRYGIKVVKIDPYHTSQTCSACGHYEEGQRQDQATFVCKSCGERLNADYNAAKNIARSTKIVEKREQCEYWRHRASSQWIAPLKGEAPGSLSSGKALDQTPACEDLQLTTAAGAQNASAMIEGHSR